MNTFGRIYRLTDFGETHGKCVGGIIDGCPSGIYVDEVFIAQELSRRAPSNHSNSTRRKEKDSVRFLSGIYENYTNGSPIAFIIENEDVIIDEVLDKIIKPSHASFVYKEKYGHTCNEQSGRASARQTVCRVVAGAIAKLILKKYSVDIQAHVVSVAPISRSGDSAGALVGCIIKNLPAGLGEPVYDKFDARLAAAMLSINACKGFEIGCGFKSALMCGSDYNDKQHNDFTFGSNHDGGVQAGITNGQDVCFQVAFKPIPSIEIEQQTIDYKGNTTFFKNNVRNDVSVAPRVLPVVEAMAALVAVDFIFLHLKNKCNFAENL